MKLKTILKKFPNMHFHLSKNKINKIKNSEQDKPRLKVKGLWYSIGNKWIEWIEREKFKKVCCYLYVVKPTEYTTLNKPDKNKVLLIDTLDKVIKFNKKYKFDSFTITTPKGEKINLDQIDWKEVANDFGGIEFNPYFSYINYKKLENILWYTSIDIPSGAIWNRKLIKLKLILEYKKNKWILIK